MAHRDVKLDNVLMARPNCLTELRLADLEAATQLPLGAGAGTDGSRAAAEVLSSTLVGTEDYMAPELVTHDQDSQDQYS